MFIGQLMHYTLLRKIYMSERADYVTAPVAECDDWLFGFWRGIGNGRRSRLRGVSITLWASLRGVALSLEKV